MIPINTKGTIRSGKYEGWSVFIQDDSENTCGYLILIERGSDGYDYWVEDLESLQQFLQESGWEIEWMPKEPV